MQDTVPDAPREKRGRRSIQLTEGSSSPVSICILFLKGQIDNAQLMKDINAQEFKRALHKYLVPKAALRTRRHHSCVSVGKSHHHLDLTGLVCRIKDVG